MSTCYTDQLKAKSTVTRRRGIENRFRSGAVVTNKRGLEDNFKATSQIGRRLYNWFPYVKGKAKIRPAGFFDTVFTSPEDPRVLRIPSRAERDSKTTVRAFFQLPDLGIETLIPQARVGEVGFDWGINQAVSWDMKIINLDRELLNPNSTTWNGYFCEGIYSNTLASRRFVKLEICTWIGTKKVYFTMPRLVIKEISPINDYYTFTISGYDEITEILTQEINLPSYCAREALGRVDDTHFLVSYLTNDSYYDVNKRSELYVNFERVESGFSYNPATKIVTFNTAIDEKYVVYMINPISKKWALNDICRKSIDRFPENITKDYFDIRCNFKKDTFFYNELSTIDTDPLTTINKILGSIPADYLILPVGNRLSLVFMDKVLGDEYPTEGDFYIPETLFRGKPSITKSSVKQYNQVDIKRYSAVYDSYEAVTVTTTE
jgi:hypothetical protein